MTDREAIDVLFNEWKCIDRNDGIHCDRKCESCDLVMDVEIIREAYNMAISALQAQELSKNSPELDKENGDLKSTCNQIATDTISRQAAIDAVVEWYGCEPNDLEYFEKIIEKKPSAQPEIIHCENCKNWQTGWWNRDWEQGYHWCSCVDGIRRCDWYCADAKRRTDDLQ